MKKRMTSLLLVLAMCFAMLPTAAFAVDDEESTMPAYSGGSGTQDDPWLISSVEDLQLLANTINDGKAAAFDADAAAGGKALPATIMATTSNRRRIWVCAALITGTLSDILAISGAILPVIMTVTDTPFLTQRVRVKRTIMAMQQRAFSAGWFLGL